MSELLTSWLQFVTEWGGIMKKMVVCPRCKGRGMIGKIVPNILTGKGAIFADYECDCCKGEGQVSEKKAESWIKRNTSVGE